MSSWTSRTWPSAQPREHPLGGRDHGRGVGGDPVAVEGRLRKLALLPPEVALARQQAVAQAGPRLAERAVLDEVAVLRDQHLLDEVGMVQHPNPHRTEPKIDDVAVGAGTLGEKPEPVALERPQMARQPVPSGTAAARCSYAVGLAVAVIANHSISVRGTVRGRGGCGRAGGRQQSAGQTSWLGGQRARRPDAPRRVEPLLDQLAEHGDEPGMGADGRRRGSCSGRASAARCAASSSRS